MWRTREVVVGVFCLIVGSVGQLVQILVSPVSSAGKAAENVAAATASPSAMSLAAWLDLTTVVCFVPGLLVIGYLAGARTTRLGFVATLVVVGTTLPGVAYVLAPDAMYAAAAKGTFPAAAIDTYAGLPVVGTSTIVFLLGHVLGIILLGVALWRAGRVPAWAAGCLIAFPIAEIGGTAADLKAVTVVGYLLLVTTSVACCLEIARERRTEPVAVPTPEPAGY